MTILVADLAAIDATRIGAPLLGGLLDHACIAARTTADAALLVAPIVGEGIALGAFQRLGSTLDDRALEGSGLSLVRRATGGPALRVGRGQIYVALDLRAPSVLGGVDDPMRALNRHVRPLLRALTSAGDLVATSGGRDVILVSSAPIAWIGIRHVRATGRTAVEAIVSVTKPFALDPALDLAHGAIAPRWLGRAPSTLEALHGRSIDVASLARAIAQVYEELAGASARFEPPGFPASRVDPDARPFTAMVEEAIGLLGAVVERDRLTIGGDLMASEDALADLGARLFALGSHADDAAITTVIEEAFAGAMLLGVRSTASITKLVRATWDRSG
jgi:hypothetical protein